jgi:hypothetical protein
MKLSVSGIVKLMRKAIHKDIHTQQGDVISFFDNTEIAHKTKKIWEGRQTDSKVMSLTHKIVSDQIK